MMWPLKKHINENVQTCVDCETVTKYSAIFFANLGEQFVEFME